MWEPPEPWTPGELVERTDDEVSGLLPVRQRLAACLHRHMLTARSGRPRTIPNVVVMGPSGGGKTHTVRTMLKHSGLPFIEINCTQYSDVGFVGSDLSSMFLNFLKPPWVEVAKEKRDMVVASERWGVVVLDEWDKWRAVLDITKSREPGRQPQRILQYEMLKIAEGDIVMSKPNDDAPPRPFWTGDMLFIAVGAFQGLNRVVEDRLDHDNSRAYELCLPEDLARYGFIEELVGRFSTILPLPPLDPNQLYDVLSGQIWPMYVRMAEDYGVQLLADDGALRKIASLAAMRPIGARALQPELEKIIQIPWSLALPGDRMLIGVPEVDGARARLERKSVA
jgi:ATP-dependent Clp protease ATP-binding subunit ClpX